MSEDEKKDFLLAEYSALRGEVIKRMEMRHQFVIYALVVAGAFLSLGAQESVSFIVPLMYPFWPSSWLGAGLTTMYALPSWACTSRRMLNEDSN